MRNGKAGWTLTAQDYSQQVINNSKGVVKQILDEAFIAGGTTVDPCTGLPVLKERP